MNHQTPDGRGPFSGSCLPTCLSARCRRTQSHMCRALLIGGPRSQQRLRVRADTASVAASPIIVDAMPTPPGCSKPRPVARPPESKRYQSQVEHAHLDTPHPISGVHPREARPMSWRCRLGPRCHACGRFSSRSPVATLSTGPPIPSTFVLGPATGAPWWHQGAGLSLSTLFTLLQWQGSTPGRSDSRPFIDQTFPTQPTP